MSDLVSIVQPLLLPEEKILSYQDSLLFQFRYVPIPTPMQDSGEGIRGGGAILTNRRFIFVNKKYYLYSVTSIIGLSERLYGANSRWPYQATIWMPGGVTLVVETEKQDMQVRGSNLSKLLTKGLFLLGNKNIDDGSMAAILAYEEQKRREEESRYYYDKRDDKKEK